MRPRRGFRLKNNSWLHFPEKNACFLFEANSRRKQKKGFNVGKHLCLYCDNRSEIVRKSHTFEGRGRYILRLPFNGVL